MTSRDAPARRGGSMTAITSQETVDLIGHAAIMLTAVVTLIVALRRSHRHDDDDAS